MKHMLFLIILGLFLVSCGGINPFSAGGGNPITIGVQSDATPVPTPPPYKLSPINAGNVDQIQTIYTQHVNWDSYAEYLLAISPNKMWVALTPKNGAPLYLQRLKWTSDDSFVPKGNGYTNFYLYQTTSLAFSLDSMHFAIANAANNSVLVFDLTDLPTDAKKTILPIGDRPEALTFTQDNQKLIIGTNGGANGSMQLWDFGAASLQQVISGNRLDDVCRAAISPDGKILAAGSCADFEILTWKVENGFKPLPQLAELLPASPCIDPCSYQNNIFAFNPATGELASAIDFPNISIHDPLTGQNIKNLTTQPVTGSDNGDVSITSLAFTSDGTILVMAANQELQLINAQTGNLFWHYEDPKRIAAVAISADSKLLISINAKGDMVYWGVPSK
jgi:WD40 repeat protein